MKCDVEPTWENGTFVFFFFEGMFWYFIVVRMNVNNSNSVSLYPGVTVKIFSFQYEKIWFLGLRNGTGLGTMCLTNSKPYRRLSPNNDETFLTNLLRSRSNRHNRFWYFYRGSRELKKNEDAPQGKKLDLGEKPLLKSESPSSPTSTLVCVLFMTTTLCITWFRTN